MAVTHATTTAEPNDPAYDISSTAWNEAHATADGSFVAAKLAASATDRVFGRSTAGAGNGEEIPLTAAGRALIDDATAADQRTTLGVATDAVAGTGSMRTLGTGAQQAAAGDHTHAVGAELSYVQFTSPVSVTQTVEASADTVVTAAGIAFDGSSIALIEFYSAYIFPDNTAAARFIQVWLFDGSTSLGRMAIAFTQVAAQDARLPTYVARRLTPTAATHTYSIRATVSAGTGTVQGGAGGAGNWMPGFIRITRVA